MGKNSDSAETKTIFLLYILASKPCHNFFYIVISSFFCKNKLPKNKKQKQKKILGHQHWNSIFRLRRDQHHFFIVYISFKPLPQKKYFTFRDNRILSFFLHIDCL